MLTISAMMVYGAITVSVYVQYYTVQFCLTLLILLLYYIISEHTFSLITHLHRYESTIVQKINH